MGRHGSLIDDEMLNAFAVVGPSTPSPPPCKALRRSGRPGAADLLSASQDCITAALKEFRAVSAPTVDEAAKVFADPLAYTDEPRLHAALAHLRANAPVSRVDVPDYRPFWAITKHADIMDIERDNMLFTNWPRPVLATAEGDELQAAIGVRTLIHLDDPQHRVVRAIGADWFRPKAMRALKVRVDELAKSLRRQDDGRGSRVRLRPAGGGQLPALRDHVAAGLPEADFPRMLKLTQELFGSDDSEFKRGATRRISCPRCSTCSSTSTG